MEAYPREPMGHVQDRTELKDQKRPPSLLTGSSEAMRLSPHEPWDAHSGWQPSPSGVQGHQTDSLLGVGSRVYREEPSPPHPTAELGYAWQAMSRVKIEPEEAWLGPVTTPASLPASHTLLSVCSGSQETLQSPLQVSRTRPAPPVLPPCS